MNNFYFYAILIAKYEQDGSSLFDPDDTGQVITELNKDIALQKANEHFGKTISSCKNNNFVGMVHVQVNELTFGTPILTYSDRALHLGGKPVFSDSYEITEEDDDEDEE